MAEEEAFPASWVDVGAGQGDTMPESDWDRPEKGEAAGRNPPWRPDRVFLVGGEATPLGFRLIGTRPVEGITPDKPGEGGHEVITPSDHYGLVVEMGFK